MYDIVITDRLRSTRREVIVSLCLSVHIRPYCYSLRIAMSSGARVAFLLLAQNCQAVGMPLAFTQEDFLVTNKKTSADISVVLSYTVHSSSFLITSKNTVIRLYSGIFSKWSGTFIEFSEFREFRESEESLKHELGSV